MAKKGHPDKPPRSANAAAEPTALAGRAAPGRLVGHVGLLAVLAAGALAVWLGYALVRPDAQAWDVPDPVSPDMTAPVVRAFLTARAGVLDRPDAAAAWGDFAVVCDAHQIYDAAQTAYEHAVELDGADFRWKYLLAIVLDFRGAPADEVSAAFERALALAPDFPPGHLRFGDALVRQGQSERALAAYRRALELDEDFALAQRNLGQALLAAGDQAGAIRHLERALEITPADATAHGSLAEAYRLAGRPDDAQRAAESARTESPVFSIPDPIRFEVDQRCVSPRACDERARRLVSEGSYNAALRDLGLLAEVLAEDASVRRRIAACRLALGDLAGARDAYELAARLEPDDATAHVQLARIALAEERQEDAAAALRAALERDPRNATMRKDLARILAQNGDFAGAVAQFEAAAALSEPDSELHHNWGTTLDRAGRKEEAVAHFRSALELDPGNPGTLLNLGLALEGLGRTDEALACYEDAAQNHPDHPAAKRFAELSGR